ncbi:acyltransferase family protein [Runella sp.]|uniref:acyltransferase family protein n=1 Tax=Runella sp. TaxID=1960881 RepID=UPI003D0C0071
MNENGILEVKTTKKGKNERAVGLDLVRAIAILLVVIHHGFFIFPVNFIPLPDGVDIFFVLSGFLIGGILIRNLEKRKQFSITDLKLFWLRRWFRTLPAYWFMLSLNLALYFLFNLQNQPIKSVLKQVLLVDKLWQYALFIQNFFSILSSSFFSESWSLSVEEWFYLFFPVVLFIALKKGLSSSGAMSLSILIIILLPLAFRFLFSDFTEKGNWLLTRMVVIMRLDAIGFGISAAYIKAYHPGLWYKMGASKLPMLIGILVFYLSIYVIYTGSVYAHSVAFVNLFFYPVTAVSVMLMLPALSKITIKNTLLKKGITFISLISYSMYLINLSVIIKIIKHFAPASMTDTGKFIAYVLYWVSTIGFATLMYHYIELPFLKLRDRYFRDT